MPDILIRDIPSTVLNELKKRASLNKRSLQQELKLILEDASGINYSKGMELASVIRMELKEKKQKYTNSVEVIRKDRKR